LLDGCIRNLRCSPKVRRSQELIQADEGPAMLSDTPRQIMRPVRRTLRDVLMLWQFGALRRQAGAKFAGRGRIYVDERDARGRFLTRNAGVTQPLTSSVLLQLVNMVDPEVILDIGANYGEMSMLIPERAGRVVYAFEPNPMLIPFLERSFSHRPDVKIVPRLVSDEETSVTFTIPAGWSGTASAAGDILGPGLAEDSFERLTVAATTIDSFLGHYRPRRLVFKIDVEGFELRVVRGMVETLAAADCYAGIVEYDEDHLSLAGASGPELTSLLRAHGVLGGMSPNIGVDPVTPHGHCDLLIASQADILAKLKIPLGLRRYSRTVPRHVLLR
jgi:FkbM family methyltransferase